MSSNSRCLVASRQNECSWLFSKQGFKAKRRRNRLDAPALAQPAILHVFREQKATHKMSRIAHILLSGRLFPFKGGVEQRLAGARSGGADRRS